MCFIAFLDVLVQKIVNKLDQVNSANLLFEFWSLFFLFWSVIESEDCDNCGKYSITLETFHLAGNIHQSLCSNSWSVGLFAEQCWSSRGPSSLQMTICKGTEEHGGGRTIQMVICNNPCSSVPLIFVIWRTVLLANDHLQRNRGGRIFRMIICNNSCSFVPLILIIRPFAKERRSTEEAELSKI